MSMGMVALVALLLPVVAGPVPVNKPETYPDWWFERDLILTNAVVTNVPPIWPSDYRPADDFAALNQGQIKFMATNAYSEMRLRLPAATWTNAPGLALESIVTNFTVIGPNTDAYAAVNHGQLKHLAKHFYDVLNAAGYTAGQGLAPTLWTSGAYPWSGSTTPADHYAAANLGQAKHLFSFDLATVFDPTVPSWWLTKYGIEPAEVTQDPDDDGLTTAQEYVAGTHPLRADTDGDGLNDNEDPAPLDGLEKLEIYTPLLSAY